MWYAVVKMIKYVICILFQQVVRNFSLNHEKDLAEWEVYDEIKSQNAFRLKGQPIEGQLMNIEVESISLYLMN